MKKLRKHIMILCAILLFGIAFLTLTANATSIFPWLSPGDNSKITDSAPSSSKPGSKQHEEKTAEDAQGIYIAPISGFSGTAAEGNGADADDEDTDQTSLDPDDVAEVSKSLKADPNLVPTDDESEYFPPSCRPSGGVQETNSDGDAGSASTPAPGSDEAGNGSSEMTPDPNAPSGNTNSSSPEESQNTNDDDNHHHKKRTVSITGVTVDPSELELLKGQSAALTATITPANTTQDKTITWSSSDETVAVVDSTGNVTAVEGGSTTITAASSNGKTAACGVTVTVPATGISLSLSDVPVERGNSVKLIAALEPADSTEKVLWATSDSNIATVDDFGNVTGVAPGTATITASVGDGTISASCQVTTVVSISELTLSDTDLDLKKGDEHQITAQILPEDTTEDKTVTWSSSDPSVASVDETGKLTAIGGGSAIITAQTGKHSAQCMVTVTVPVTGIIFNPDSVTVARGTTVPLSPVISPSDATDKAITYGSSDQSIAKVDQDGKVTGVSVGTATITAITHDGNYVAQCTVRVIVPVTGISLDKADLSLIKGQTAALKETITPADATDKTITWSSSDDLVVTVDDSGNLTAIGGGTATVTATTHDGGFSASCNVTVTVPVTGISLTSTISLAINNSKQLVPGFNPSDATDQTVSWSSSDASVATVSDTGIVTAVGSGAATITVTTHDGGFTDHCVVNVGYTWDSTHSVTEQNGSRTTVTPSSQYSSMVTFPGDEGVGTATSVYHFDHPVLLPAGSTMRAIQKQRWRPDTSILINGVNIGSLVTPDGITSGGAIANVRNFKYVFEEDTLVESVEIISSVGERGKSDATPIAYTALYIKPKDGDTFFLNNSGTSAGQSCSSRYYVGISHLLSDDETYVSLRDYYIHYAEGTGRCALIQFVEPKSIDHITIDSPSSYSTNITLGVSDFGGSDYFSEAEETISSSTDVANFSSENIDADWDNVSDLKISCDNSHGSINVPITIYFTDGTSLRLGSNTCHEII